MHPMIQSLAQALLILVITCFSLNTLAANTVPSEIQMPGTQPHEVLNLDMSQCPQCHGSYDSAVEPYHNWRGSMMSQAGRDPLFWATLAVAERGFDGAGDFCLRCHTPKAWLAGRSTPTDGSGLIAGDGNDGVQCDVCHRLTNPDKSEWQGVQNAPFIAKTGTEGNYGSGQYVLGFDTTRYGPYKDAAPPHQTRASQFQRSSALCGTCHDVSNPLVGDLAPNNGAQQALPLGKFSGVLGDAITNKAAFKNPPYGFGIVERTFSEHMASAFPNLRMADYNNLPAELKNGSIKKTYEAATRYISSGNYADGTTRYFTCQSCHLPPVRGKGSWIGGLTRNDLPKHDLTGGNYWVPMAIQWLDDRGLLRIGNGIGSAERKQMNDGAARARLNLQQAASLQLNGNTLKVVNLTGHKLITGYPEGRRMWLNMRWYNSSGTLLREDGGYGDLAITLAGQSYTVRTLKNLNDPNTRVYEAHGSITQEWAQRLLQLGTDPNIPVQFNRVSSALIMNLADVAALSSGAYAESFHFVLDNKLAKDTRIPPYQMRRDEAAKRNALPVPATQYGNPNAGGIYRHWDEVTLNPPAGATRAEIKLWYQPTSWEYIQFLYLANDGNNPQLRDTGKNLFNAWLNTGMAEPQLMTSINWQGS
ncbi:MAG: hypothetical protein H0W44_08860 [Gammaproteobacteria bacterium]|nr:hypothetical protein [Gammaproteobacteria bacterium]